MSFKKMRPLGIIVIILVTANWSGEQNTSPWKQGNKNSVNFFGTLYTRNGEIYPVDNISIGRLIKDIKAYEVPPTTNIELAQDPTAGIITKLDLVEISSISTVQPIIPRFYQRRAGGKQVEYIEIEVTQAKKSAIGSDRIQKGTIKDRYLIERRRELLCDKISPSGSIEKKVPFDALDHIDIDGFKKREEETTIDKNTKKMITKECECTIKTSQARPDAPHTPSESQDNSDNCNPACPSECPPEEPTEPSYGIRTT